MVKLKVVRALKIDIIEWKIMLLLPKMTILNFGNAAFSNLPFSYIYFFMRKGEEMAERRMFAKTIIDSDAFLDMPMSAQALYFHLSMRADDDGFVNNPKKIQRMIGASDDDLKILWGKNFILSFETGVIVIKHWRMHNYIQKDRYKPTNYQEEMSQLYVKDNKSYTLEKPMDTRCIQDVSIMETQDRLGKDSLELGKDRKELEKELDKAREEKSMTIYEMYQKYCPRLKAYANEPLDLTDIAKEIQMNGLDIEKVFKMANQSDFLAGVGGGWKADLRWLIIPKNAYKVLDGRYVNRNKQSFEEQRTYDYDELERQLIAKRDERLKNV